MLTLERFKSLADSYGANLERWPAETREAARGLLDTSQAARASLAQAEVLDEAIAAGLDGEQSQTWPPETAADALTRLRSRVALAITERESALSGGRSEAWLSYVRALLHPLHAGWSGLLTGGVIAIAAGLAVGLSYTSSPPPGDVLFFLEPTPLQIFSD